MASILMQTEQVPSRGIKQHQQTELGRAARAFERPLAKIGGAMQLPCQHQDRDHGHPSPQHPCGGVIMGQFTGFRCLHFSFSACL